MRLNTVLAASEAVQSFQRLSLSVASKVDPDSRASFRLRARQEPGVLARGPFSTARSPDQAEV